MTGMEIAVCSILGLIALFAGSYLLATVAVVDRDDDSFGI